MRMKPPIMDAVLRTQIGSRMVSERRYRIILSATGSLCINIAYALYHGVLGMMHLSAWFIVMWAYYMILGATRFCASGVFNAKEFRISLCSGFRIAHKKTDLGNNARANNAFLHD